MIIFSRRHLLRFLLLMKTNVIKLLGIGYDYILYIYTPVRTYIKKSVFQDCIVTTDDKLILNTPGIILYCVILPLFSYPVLSFFLSFFYFYFFYCTDDVLITFSTELNGIENLILLKRPQIEFGLIEIRVFFSFYMFSFILFC